MKLRTVVISLVIPTFAVAAAGCGGSEPIVTETPSPRVSATASASPSPSPSPSPSDDGELSDEELAELLPEEATIPDTRGAISVATRYVEMLGEIFVDPDFAEWSALSTAECNYCAAQVKATQEFYDLGWVAEGGETEISAGPVEANLAEDGYAYVSIEASFDTLYAYGPDGERVVSEEANTKELFLQLEYRDPLWKVRGVQYEVLN